MFKKLIFTFCLFFSSLITFYPSKKENTDLLDYCYSFEKIITRNTIEKSKNVSKKFRILQKILLYMGIKNQRALANKIIDQYKISKKSLF